MQGKKSEKRHQELLKEKKELEDNRPHSIEEMRRWNCLLYTSDAADDSALV